jgi:N-acetylglucosamine malate deacetylase 1
MVKLNKEINPDLVFLPCKNDVHQDHHTIYQEGVRAFKFRSIFSYELPWNNFSMHTSAFVILDENNINSKIKALAEYKSQAHRPYANEEFIRSLARTRGVQINTQYAESFEIIRSIL